MRLPRNVFYRVLHKIAPNEIKICEGLQLVQNLRYLSELTHIFGLLPLTVYIKLSIFQVFKKSTLHVKTGVSFYQSYIKRKSGSKMIKTLQKNKTYQ